MTSFPCPQTRLMIPHPSTFTLWTSFRLPRDTRFRNRLNGAEKSKLLSIGQKSHASHPVLRCHGDSMLLLKSMLRFMFIHLIILYSIFYTFPPYFKDSLNI